MKVKIIKQVKWKIGNKINSYEPKMICEVRTDIALKMLAGKYAVEVLAKKKSDKPAKKAENKMINPDYKETKKKKVAKTKKADK